MQGPLGRLLGLAALSTVAACACNGAGSNGAGAGGEGGVATGTGGESDPPNQAGATGAGGTPVGAGGTTGDASSLATAASAGTGGTTAGDICLDFADPVLVGTAEIAALDQLSGLVASREHPGVLFAHEDSTGAPIVHALDVSGSALAELTLEGAPNNDWEDIAIGPGPDGGTYLFIGDIGDNPVRTGGTPRTEIQVVRLPEPDLSPMQDFVQLTLTTLDVLRFTYPSGIHESETLMVDPTNGDLVIVTRSAVGDSHVFRTPGSTPPETPTVLEEIATVAFEPSGNGALATAGDISPAGDRVMVRTYTSVYLWPRPSGASLASAMLGPPRVIAWAVEPQGEGISFSADGHAWLSSGEQRTEIYQADEICP